MPKSTRLRYLKAKTEEEVSAAVTRLPFKVEIKGAPVWNGKRWVLWFVLPEEDGIEMGNMEIS